MEDVKGSEYLQKIKEALKSKEFQSYTSPQRPYIIKFAELFSDNELIGSTEFTLN